LFCGYRSWCAGCLDVGASLAIESDRFSTGRCILSLL
jgi:hypothetical protein